MAVLLALTLDWFLREPPARLHPVVWMGAYLNRVGRKLTSRPPASALLLGTGYWLMGAVLVLAVYGALAWQLEQLADSLKLLFTALLLKPLFAFRMLLDEVNAVEKLLEESLEAARTRLSHLVSRPAEALSPNEVRESALESLAENLNDSLVAPLFWFVLLGLPGAALYRFANTADALWGYRGSWEWAGKFAARADDCLSYIPARITGLLLCGWRCPWKALWREARKTPSPNSGWPMAALALFLGIRLSKPNVYVLHSSGRLPTAQDLQAGLSRAIWVGWSAGLVAGLCTWNSGQAILGLF